METDVATIYSLLDEPRISRTWIERAQVRREAVERLMWDEQAGYLRLRFYQQQTLKVPVSDDILSAVGWSRYAETGRRHSRQFARLRKSGGLRTSANNSGAQWDGPFGWAPLHLIAIEGLRRYGFDESAERISEKFLAMITGDFAKRRTIREKYDVVQDKSDLGHEIEFGYVTNESGFGWTNAVFLLLYDELSAAGKRSLAQACLR
jgi:alpha,alpha-trehalase